jgi:hypothetical protein
VEEANPLDKLEPCELLSELWPLRDVVPLAPDDPGSEDDVSLEPLLAVLPAPADWPLRDVPVPAPLVPLVPLVSLDPLAPRLLVSLPLEPLAPRLLLLLPLVRLVSELELDPLRPDRLLLVLLLPEAPLRLLLCVPAICCSC